MAKPKLFGYRTSKATAANQWTKIANITLTAQGQTATVHLKLSGGVDGGATGTSPIANLFFRVNQVAAMAVAPVIDIRLMENQNITISEFMAVTATNTIATTSVDLYVKIVDINEQFMFMPMMINGQTVTLYDSQSLLTSLSGTQTAAVYDTVDAAALPVATSGAYGAVKVSSGNGLSYSSGTISHTTGAGFNHIPTGGATGNVLKWSSSGVATWVSLTAADVGAAATSHGNHVPTTQTANDAVYLRNDNSWQTITAAKIGAVDATDFANSELYKFASVATTANITLSGSSQTIDGVLASAGSTVLVKDQSLAAENGVYTVAAGAWTRHTDFNTISKVKYTKVKISSGAVNASKIYAVWNAPTTLGSSTIFYDVVGSLFSPTSPTFTGTVSMNAKVDYNTVNGRLIVPVGTNKYAT